MSEVRDFNFKIQVLSGSASISHAVTPSGKASISEAPAAAGVFSKKKGTVPMVGDSPFAGLCQIICVVLLTGLFWPVQHVLVQVFLPDVYLPWIYSVYPKFDLMNGEQPWFPGAGSF